MLHPLRALAVLCGAALSALPAQSRIDYVIRPIPAIDRIELDVTMSFPIAGTTTLVLPRDRYGTPSLHECIVALEGLDGTRIEATDDPARRRCSATTERANVRYRLSFDPERSAASAFAPRIGARHFHFLGCQWMVRHTDDKDAYEFSIEVRDLPDGHGVFGSFGVGAGPHTMTGSYADLVETSLAGGEFGADRFEIDGQTVVTAVSPGFALDTDEILAAVRKVVTGQRRLMPPIEQPFFTVCINARPGVTAGVALRNAFTCFIDGETTRERLLLLLAHEMFHTWLPGQGEIVGPDRDVSEMRYEWIHEGFTEYVARRLLYDTGLTDRAWFVARFNSDLRALAVSDAADIDYAELRRREDEGAFTNIEEALAYTRGPLLALAWDARIREHTDGERTLFDAMRTMIERATARGNRLPEAEFVALLAEHGVDVMATLERHILRGETIEPAADAFAPDFARVRTVEPGFDPGFDLQAANERKVITGLVADSPAQVAGLRDGMRVVRIENGRRASRLWRADAPLVVVIDDEGSERRIEFMPRPTEIAFWQFEPRR